MSNERVKIKQLLDSSSKQELDRTLQFLQSRLDMSSRNEEKEVFPNTESELFLFEDSKSELAAKMMMTVLNAPSKSTFI